MNKKYSFYAGLMTGFGFCTLFTARWYLGIALLLMAVFFRMLDKSGSKEPSAENSSDPRTETVIESEPRPQAQIPKDKICKTGVSRPTTLPEEEIGIDKQFEYKLWDTGVLEILGYLGTRSFLVIPDTLAGHPVIWIGDSAFRKNRTLQEVTIPEGVSAIGFYAFDGCERLHTVRIPDSVESMGPHTFRGCSNVTVVANPGSYAEKHCSCHGIRFRSAG